MNGLAMLWDFCLWGKWCLMVLKPIPGGGGGGDT